MSNFSKRNKTKKVVFNKDYKGIYKKNETHYIHEDIVKKRDLAKFGSVSDVNFKEEYKKAAEVLKKESE